MGKIGTTQGLMIPLAKLQNFQFSLLSSKLTQIGIGVLIVYNDSVDSILKALEEFYLTLDTSFHLQLTNGAD